MPDKLKRVGTFLLGAAPAPFIQTGIYRITPYFGFLWFLVPVVALGIGSFVIWRKGSRTFAAA